MAKQYPAIDDSLRDFILRQRIFFTATATAASRVNISPRGIEAHAPCAARRVTISDW